MPAPSALAYLAKAIVTALQGRGAIYVVVAYVLYRRFTVTALALRLRANDTLRQYLGRAVLLLPAASGTFSKEITKQLVPMRERARKIYDEFGFLHTKIPDNGMSLAELKALVDQMSAVPQRHCEAVHMSGSIYSFSYKPQKPAGCGGGGGGGGEGGGGGGGGKGLLETKASEDLDAPSVPQSPEDYTRLSEKLREIFTYSFQVSYLWNSLHGTEFGVGDFLSYQCVRMVADIYGGAPDQVMGFVTSGGTESIMTAVRAYREWGIANRGLKTGEGVILAGKSVHAALMKGGLAYDVVVELLPVDEYDQLDLASVRRAAKRLGKRLIAIVGSTPSYPLGTIDDVRGLAALAKELGVGMHVDSCLGGFIVNFVDTVDARFLAMPGVTSLSCDTHKNGWAPKGSSVCVMTEELPDRTFGRVNLAYYAMYAIPGWTGGVYGTPNNAGSQQCTGALHAYLAMLAVGKNGYRKLAQDVVGTGRRMAEVIKAVPELKLLAGGDGE
jgi:hypothetical protein